MSGSGARTFKLNRLVLTNFRRFEHFEIAFDDRLTVLVAENGCGKTAVLDAAAAALSSFVAVVSDGTSISLYRTDARLQTIDAHQTLARFPIQVAATGTVETGLLFDWYVRLEKAGGRTRFGGPAPIAQYADNIRESLSNSKEGNRPMLPVIAYYGTGRLWNESRKTTKRRTTAKDLRDATGAYLDCLGSASNYKQFVEWFERVVREALDETQTGRPSPYRPAELLRAVQKATERVLAPVGWHTLGWDHLAHDVVATHNERGRLPVSMLSDGVRNILGIVADLAHRCVRLNPQFGADACELTAGVVLIDEVDMHLHPQWQQTVVQSLLEAFPRVQFILTTHSPQVLSTVEAQSIRILGADGSVTTPDEQTKGTLSSDILLDVMAVNPSPDLPETKLLADYQKLIQLGQGSTAAADAMRSKLIKHYGAEHSVIRDCDRMLRMFTRRAAIAG